MSSAPNKEVHLLTLPPEIRNEIYTHLAHLDLEIFAETTAQPALLQTSHQLRDEYSSIFFSHPGLQIEAYHGLDNSWTTIRHMPTKRRVIEESLLTDLLHFWSLASARRYCQRIYSDHQGAVETGIITIRTRAGIRRWQWSMALSE